MTLPLYGSLQNALDDASLEQRGRIAAGELEAAARVFERANSRRVRSLDFDPPELIRRLRRAAMLLDALAERAENAP